jgi:hypothetical protein
MGNTAVAFAATDVPSSHWANSQINSVVKEGIVPLFSDNTFKPDSVVTNLEVVVSIYRAIKAAGLINDAQVVTITAKHEASLKALNIPPMLAPYGSDVYPALAYALEQNILTLDEIKVFISGSTLTNVKKVNAIVMVAKALNQYKQENLNKIILLSYKDSAEISLIAIKYVNLLIEYGIISNKGDSEGKFNPNATINRATMAILVDGLYKALIQNPVVPQATTETTNEPVVIAAEKIFSGTVSAVNDALMTISVTNASNKTESFVLTEAVVTAGGQKASFNRITLGAKIELTLRNGEVTIAALEKELSQVEGGFVLLTDFIGTTQNRRSLKIQTASGAFDFKNVYDDTVVTIDGVPSLATKLAPGFKLIVLYDGFDAKRIIAYSSLYEFYGILDADLNMTNPGTISITQESGNIYSGTLDKNVVYANATQGFKKGDIVKVTTKFGIVTRLDYIGQAKTVVGTIGGIHIKKTPEITMNLSTGKSESHVFSSRVKLLNENGDNTLTIYDLRLDQEVTVTIGIGGVTTVQLGRKIITEPTGIKVTVSQVIESSNIMLVVDENSRMRTVTFPVGSQYKATNYKAGNVLYIEGKAIAESIFEVIKITVQAQ